MNFSQIRLPDFTLRIANRKAHGCLRSVRSEIFIAPVQLDISSSFRSEISYITLPKELAEIRRYFGAIDIRPLRRLALPVAHKQPGYRARAAFGRTRARPSIP